MSLHQYDSLQDVICKAPDETKIDSLCATINLLLQKMNLVVVVEGDTDKKIIGKLLDTKTIQVIPSNGGNSVAQKVINKVLDKRLIGINDSDFKVLLNIEISPRIFLTDTHDFEMLMLKEVDIITSLRHEYEIEIDIQKVFTALNNLTLLRLYQYKENLVIKFAGLRYSDNELSMEQLINVLHKRTSNARINIDAVNLLKNYLDEHDPFLLHNGHDVVSYITTQITNTKKTSASDMEAIIRVAYQKRHFENTALYKNIMGYCEGNEINL